MKIAIDARNLTGNWAGVGRYLHNLLVQFAAMDRHDYYLYSHKTLDDSFEHDRFHYNVRHGHPLIWKQCLLPIDQLRQNYDLFFVPTYSAPVIYPGKILLTIHDMIFTKYPEWATWKQAVRFKAIIPLTSKRADCIIAVSETTRTDIIEQTGIAGNKVEVIYLGVDSVFKKLSASEAELFRKKYKIDFPYILHVGSIHPRRNLKRVAEAYLQLKKDKKIEHHLIMVGPSLVNRAELQSYLDDEYIHYVGYVPDTDLVGFYSEATLLVYPSLYEGFGLPVLEAMACETAVVTSNVSSMPEVAGNAALLVEPENTSEIAQAMYRLISEASMRHDFQMKGKERSGLFTWEKTAQQTNQLMESTV